MRMIDKEANQGHELARQARKLILRLKPEGMEWVAKRWLDYRVEELLR
jgi:hypothetical protein